MKKLLISLVLFLTALTASARDGLASEYFQGLSQPDLFYELWNLLDYHDWAKLEQGLPYLEDIDMEYRTAKPGDDFYKEGRHVYYDFEGATLLQIASAIGDEGDVAKGVQALIDAGANVNKPQLILPEGKQSRTALDIAHQYSHSYCSKEIISTLVNNGGIELLDIEPSYAECA